MNTGIEIKNVDIKYGRKDFLFGYSFDNRTVYNADALCTDLYQKRNPVGLNAKKLIDEKGGLEEFVQDMQKRYEKSIFQRQFDFVESNSDQIKGELKVLVEKILPAKIDETEHNNKQFMKLSVFSKIDKLDDLYDCLKQIGTCYRALKLHNLEEKKNENDDQEIVALKQQLGIKLEGIRDHVLSVKSAKDGEEFSCYEAYKDAYEKLDEALKILFNRIL